MRQAKKYKLSSSWARKQSAMSVVKAVMSGKGGHFFNPCYELDVSSHLF